MLTVFRFGPEGAPVVTGELGEWPPPEDEQVWVDMEAPTDAELELFERPFGFHPLAIEDCLTPSHQPKIEDFGPYLFLIFRGIDFNPPIVDFQTLKLAAFLGPNWLVTYRRRPMRSVAAVREKYGHERGVVPPRGPDALLYEILDHLIEHYFPVLEELEDRIDMIEEELFQNPEQELLDRILETKRRVLDVKRTLSPHRELFGRVSRGEFEEISGGTVAFYRDLYDSTYRLTEIADSYRDLLSGTLEAYLSVVSQRLNEVMKVLTIFATIMLPLTFIVGVYGMNFDHMPELHWRYGYYGVWAVMIGIAAWMLWLFRRRKWL